MATQVEDAGPAVRVGSVIRGKWTIDALLGVGGMAAVYAATHRNMTRAALKILHIDFAREKAICERFLREAYVSNKVGHPASVQVLDDDITELEEPFLVMELLEGETVRDSWKRSGRVMSVPKVLEICEVVLDCLSACHAAGVIHRDLKPANIFLTKDGMVKVLDFGVAQMRSATAERTASGTALGTPAYMSPEQAMGLVDQLDGRADIFSVGAMMHALITGHRINHGRTEQEALVMAATKPVPSVARLAPNLPIEVIQIIDKALQWDRRNRFADALEMQTAVQTVMAGMGVSPIPFRGRLNPGQSPEVNSPGAPPVATPPVVGLVPAVLVSGNFAAPGPGHPIGDMRARMSSAPSLSPAPLLAPAAPAAVEPDEPMATEDDPRVVRTRDLLRHVDRLLPSVRQFGWAHPATERMLRTAFDAFVEALASEPRALALSVRPYSFMRLGQTVWEPPQPFDAVPYNLFACGIRTLRVEPGITLEELKELFELLLLDPTRDLPPEDDLAAALWDRGFEHVSHECVDAFAEGDAAEREAFYSEADQVQVVAERAAAEHANRIEARAMAISTDRSAARGRGASPMSFDAAVRSVIGPQLTLPNELWSERYVEALAWGYVDAAFHRDAPLVLSSLRRSGADLLVAGRFDVVVQLHQALTAKLEEFVAGNDLARMRVALTNALFGAENLNLTVRHLGDHPEQAEAVAGPFLTLGSNEFGHVLELFRTPQPKHVREVLMGYVTRLLPGREAEVTKAAVGMPPEASAELIGLVGRTKTQAARQSLADIQQSDDVDVRVEAKILLAGSPENALGDLTQMLEQPSAALRSAAARAIGRYGLKGALAALTKVVRQSAFGELPIEERRELLRALARCSPERGEPLVLEMAKKTKILASEEHEAHRILCIEVLGEVSRGAATVSGLREVGQARWGTTEATRAAAHAAVQAISQRVEGEARS